MNGFSILMLLFGLGILLAGIYIYTGHRNEVLLWKTHNVQNLTMEELKNIGKWTMISSLIPFFLSILGFFLDI